MGHRSAREKLLGPPLRTLLELCDSGCQIAFLLKRLDPRTISRDCSTRSKNMKVVLFCGGLGMRLREYSESIPKPMVNIGYRPILWHVMKYYAHHGHKDFILCLGYRADVVKHYFLNYNECLSNDFVLSDGGKKLELMGSDIHDWKITFVETGRTSNSGKRLKAGE